MPDYDSPPGVDLVLEGPVAIVGGSAPPPGMVLTEAPGQLQVVLGKKPAKRDLRDLLYADYRRPQALSTPAAAHWGHGLTYSVLGNDRFGNCVECGAQNALETVWDRASGGSSAYVPDAAATLADYSAISGFDVADPSTDRGTSMRDACSFWKATGIGAPGGVRNKVSAYLALNAENEVHAREAVHFYGGLYLGLAMPESAQAQTFVSPWEVTTGAAARPGSWGGHCVWCTGYDAAGLWCVTWGGFQKMSWDFYGTYADEGYVLLFPQWLSSSGYSPSGLRWGQLQTDLNSL